MKLSNIALGSFYALLAFFLMAVFGILTKLAIQNSSVLWVSFFTYVAGTLFLSGFIAREGWKYLKSEHYGYLFSRALFGCLASFLYTISIDYIPIVNATLLFNTAPIFIPILAIFWLKSKIDKYIWIAVVIGFVGIAFIIRPTEEIFKHIGNFIGLFSGLSLAIAYLTMKLLTKTDHGLRIIFYYLGIGTLVQIPLLFYAGSLPGMESLIYAACSGIVLVIAQFALIKGYSYAEAWQIAPYQYSSIAFVGLIEWLIWNNVPGIYDLIGIALVTIAGIIIIRYGVNGQKSPQPIVNK